MPVFDKKMLTDEIQDLVAALQEQMDMMLANEGNLSRIEFDLLLGNLRNIYDKVYWLQKTVLEPPKAETPPTSEKPIPPFRLKFEGRSIPSHPEEKPKEPVAEKPKTSPIPPPKPRTGDLFSETPPTLAEKLQPEKPSVIDRISSQVEDKSVASNLMHKPLADIKAAIGINEKFLFINELFGGSMQEYTQAIQELNQARSLEEALELFENYAARYKWNPRLPGVIKLKELVQRRYL
ncbi:MAG: hypothetical protein PWR20_1049 [Bacteroidales bacterium]|jgi:hypothetical protein|nr:hypothetical protein [Bacteroidales bacterium]MDN5328273.1 hypothetical protein [Bacteroidales bacterium]